ncbi:MAG: 16S rRNA (guanine(966)-N(2))-methyltransferase RsmD [Anaerotignum sp.]|nr:16S rRNA (guanine(966)-N(2))-methyltransferase RsmD [Anaerotignum sp.]
MRIIAGKAKGHKLETIDGLATRPTTDRIKETLFNMISFDLPGCRFLDLFAGSGAIGMEALSRGAEQAVFVENAAPCQDVIARNLAHTKLGEGARVLCMEASAALDRLAEENAAFDLVYIDPPYEAGLAEPMLEKILEKNLLSEDGYVIWERAAKRPFAFPAGYAVLREKEYRTTVLTFLRPEDRTK